jgi:hypothetical protein
MGGASWCATGMWALQQHKGTEGARTVEDGSGHPVLAEQREEEDLTGRRCGKLSLLPRAFQSIMWLAVPYAATVLRCRPTFGTVAISGQQPSHCPACLLKEPFWPGHGGCHIGRTPLASPWNKTHTAPADWGSVSVAVTAPTLCCPNERRSQRVLIRCSAALTNRKSNMCHCGYSCSYPMQSANPVPCLRKTTKPSDY